MIKKLLKLIVLSFAVITVNMQNIKAQADSTDGWKYNGIFSLTAQQVSFSNWAAGGENSYSINGLVALGADYKQGKHLWENDLITSYGIMKQGEKEIRKTDDNFEINSKYGYQASKSWYYSGLVNFKTQFAEGFKYDDKAGTKTRISTFLAPAYLNIAAGMTYKPSAVFNMFIGPISGKTTFVMDKQLADAGAFGVTPGDKVKNEFGATFKAELNKDIVKNVNLLTKLQLFSSYTDKPQNIDVDWQLLLSMKINEWLSANINLHMIYDDDIKGIDDSGKEIGPQVQFKEVFGVGLSYKF